MGKQPGCVPEKTGSKGLAGHCSGVGVPSSDAQHGLKGSGQVHFACEDMEAHGSLSNCTEALASLRRTWVPGSFVLFCLPSPEHLLQNTQVTFPWGQAQRGKCAYGPEISCRKDLHCVQQAMSVPQLKFPLIQIHWQWAYSVFSQYSELATLQRNLPP